MKAAPLLALMLISGLSCAGTLTIIPDSTSSMGIQQQQRDAALRAQTERRARIAAGLEAPPRVIVVKPRPQYAEPPKTNYTCQASGYQNQTISCY